MTSATPKRFSRWAISLLKRWQTPPKAHLRGQDPGNPLGLEDQQVQALRHLLQSPQWRHYQAVLETVTLNNVEQLLRALPHDQYLFYSGVVFACRRITSLPEQILATVAKLEDDKNARINFNDTVERSRAATFLNTPWWDSYSADPDTKPPFPSFSELG